MAARRLWTTLTHTHSHAHKSVILLSDRTPQPTVLHYIINARSARARRGTDSHACMSCMRVYAAATTITQSTRDRRKLSAGSAGSNSPTNHRLIKSAYIIQSQNSHDRAASGRRCARSRVFRPWTRALALRCSHMCARVRCVLFMVPVKASLTPHSPNRQSVRAFVDRACRSSHTCVAGM